MVPLTISTCKINIQISISFEKLSLRLPFNYKLWVAQLQFVSEKSHLRTQNISFFS